MGHRLRWRTDVESEVQIRIMEALFNALKKATSVAAWKINFSETISTELFYVQKKVETNRATDINDISVTIYIDKDGKRGSATFTVYPYMEEEEISSLIEENIFAASFTFNTFFDLPSPEAFENKKAEGNLTEIPFRELIGKIGAAIMKANHFENGSLSATEIFLTKTNTRIVNSNGVDVSTTSYGCKIETIPNWVKGEEEVELYKSIEFSSFDADALTKEVEEALLLAKARSEAIKLPHLDSIPVILENEEAFRFFGSYAMELSYLTKYSHQNHYEVGDKIQDNRIGDIMDMELRPSVEGAISSCFVDRDGVVLKPVKIVDGGIAKAMFGPFREGYYLGVKKPTGEVPILCVKEGETSIKEIEKKPYIRCVRFSDAQFDKDSGFFGGEVRLGFYFDGKKEIPVTGFTIQGNLNKAKNEFIASKERVVLSRYSGPKYVCIPNVNLV